MASGDAYDVFVSYARGNSAVAADLNSWLCAQGLTTFFDRSALRAGRRWVPALEEAIGRSKASAILVGKHGIGNRQQTGNAKICGCATRHSTGTVQRLRIDVAAFVFSA
jgi:TIR domain